MTTFNNHPLNTLITRLSETKGSKITFDELKIELTKSTNEKQHYHINFKENDDLCILYYDNFPKSQDSQDGSLQNERDEFTIELEQSLRSCVIEKDTLKIVSTQFNKILYNENATPLLNSTSWDQVIVNKCHEGTMLVVFCHNDAWYVSTRRCLDSNDSKWIKDKSYREMFDETIRNSFSLDDLEKDNVYYFILVHYKNRNIVDNSQIGDNYKNIIHTMTTKKYTTEEVDYVINDNVERSEEALFQDLNSVHNRLSHINEMDERNKHVSTEGYVLRVYDGEVKKSEFTIVKLQTKLYQKMMKIKPNNSNMHQIYLELYQNDTLHEFLPYYTNYADHIRDVIRRISESMKTLSKEILDIYHATRKKKNQGVYENLKDQYKKAMYELHGQYIKNRERDFVDGVEKSNMEKRSRPIRVHDVYHYLKKLQPQQLRKIYYERMQMIDEEKCMHINNICTHTKVQTSLMFKELQNSSKSNKKKNEVSLSSITSSNP